MSLSECPAPDWFSLREQNWRFSEAPPTSQLLLILGMRFNAVLLSVCPLPSLENFFFASFALTLEVFFC